MAVNKKIFDLPLRTGVTADDRLAIVDSGNTTTYSVRLSDLQDGTGVNTLESLTGNITFSGTNIDISTDGQTIILSGSTGGGGGGGSSFFSADTDNNVLQIDRGHGFISGDSSNTMLYNFILGGSGNTMNNTTRTGVNLDRNVILGGYSNKFAPDSNNRTTRNAAIIGGQSNIYSRESDNGAIIGGQSNVVNYGYRGVIAGGTSNSFVQSDNFVGGGTNNQVQNNRSGIVAGYSHFNRSTESFIGGGYDHYLQSYNLIGNGFIGGYINYMNNTERCFIGGGSNHDINGVAVKTSNSAIIGGDLGFISGHSRSVILGGSGLTTSFNDEVVCEHLTIKGQSTYNWFNNGSGNVFILDLDEGNLQEISMSDDTIIDLTNVKIGGRYSIKVFNEGAYSILLMTATDFNVLWEGATIPPITNNGTDLLVLEVFGSDILVRHFANFG